MSAEALSQYEIQTLKKMIAYLRMALDFCAAARCTIRLPAIPRCMEHPSKALQSSNLESRAHSRNSEGLRRVSPSPESSRTCARYPEPEAAPSSAGGIAQTLMAAAAATQELSVSPTSWPPQAMSQMTSHYFCAGNLHAPTAPTPSPRPGPDRPPVPLRAHACTRACLAEGDESTGGMACGR